MDLEAERKQWEEKVLRPLIDKYPERKNEFETPSGIPMPRVALPVERDYLKAFGFPGEYPFTRGVQPTMYRGRFWTMRQYAGYATAEESNQRYRYLLAQGQTGLSVAFDLPTQIGYDADDSMAAGEVGKVGVSISSLHDMETLFREIPLDKVSTSMTINAPAAVLLAMYIAVARRQGVEEKYLRGTIQNDVLKEYVARGTYIFPPKPSMRLITDVFQYCARSVPRWNTISISGYHIREAGSTAVQEVAFTLADAIAYAQSAIDAGLEVDDFAAQLSFFFAAHNDFLEEIAKFRAARRLWAEIMRNRFGAKKPTSWMLRFHTQTGGSTLTAQQPENNIVRVAIQAMAAVLGGTQSLHTNSMDEALWLPTEKSVRVALRTQQIIANESGVADTIDPLGGSYVIEQLTDEICRRAMAYIQKIDAMGGALAAIENGYMQSEIQESAFRFQKAVETGEQVVVGVNAYQTKEALDLESLQVDPALEVSQRKRLKSLRAVRDAGKASELLTRLDQTARTSENLMPLLIECVEHDLTLGEICGVLRRAWGEYQPPSWL
ncbi:MAG TPA: methylmalonyl-CoA mutase family protein [Anaerolineaceae bacterium]|nr:methylmalonyl-CoA mutase family protein [Anaerolineaceae bacterium]